jgi:lipopolysaccharide/colanic/teichoic acid biosynthesis glycosyltransferase
MSRRRASASPGLPRSVEVALASAGLAALWPVLLGCAVAVKTTSTGPVLFRQKRMGKDGRPFTLMKFRTMRVNNAGLGVTAKNDQRITRVGALLRKSKLDELPELFNIVLGDMSFVGPRPEVERYVNLKDPLWQEVLQARPGLTDPVTLRLRNEEELLAAVDGDRERFYLDVLQQWKLRGYTSYLRERTWQRDVQLIIDTVLAVAMPARTPPPTREEIESSG